MAEALSRKKFQGHSADQFNVLGWPNITHGATDRPVSHFSITAAD